MKNRIEALEAGDLKSKIEIIGEDELADLSFSMNQLIEDINIWNKRYRQNYISKRTCIPFYGTTL